MLVFADRWAIIGTEGSEVTWEPAVEALLPGVVLTWTRFGDRFGCVVLFLVVVMATGGRASVDAASAVVKPGGTSGAVEVGPFTVLAVGVKVGGGVDLGSDETFGVAVTDESVVSD